MALACKVNIYPLAILLPGAFIIRHFISQKETDATDNMPAAEDEQLKQSSAYRQLLVTNYYMSDRRRTRGIDIIPHLPTLCIRRTVAKRAVDQRYSGTTPSSHRRIRPCRGIFNGRGVHIYIRSQISLYGGSGFHLAFSPGLASSIWAGASSKASGVMRCYGDGQRCIFSGSRFNLTRPCAINCPSIHCLR